MRDTLNKIIKLGVVKTLKQTSNEKKMLDIIKNVWKTRNITSTDPTLWGHCRVNFEQTYGELFKGNPEEIWEKATEQKFNSNNKQE